MGSLTSRPKINSSSPQVVYIPTPAGSTPASQSPGPATPSTPANTDAQPNEEQARAVSLLLRDRGRFGTVLTGFRGLLAPMDGIGGRKTLLGE